MRHKPDLTPTARLCLLVAERENKPLTYPELELLTGCGRAALEIGVPSLIEKGRLVRIQRNGISAFILPANPATVEASQQTTNGAA